MRQRQSSSHWRSVVVINIKSGLPDMAISMGVNRLRPPGIPMEACCHLPASFWNLFSVIRRFFCHLCIKTQMSLYFFTGNCMVPFKPSVIHPNIYLTCSHVPYTFSSLDIATGLNLLWPVTAGGGNMACIACSIAQKIWSRCA